MDFTGERFIPELDLGMQIETEHYHRYLAVKDLAKGRRVLDAACGEGYGTQILSEYSKSIVGVDISAEAIQLAKKRYTSENIEFCEATIEKIPYPDSSFDMIVSFETIEHVDEEIQEAFLKEVSRLLKKDGLLIISTPNKEVDTIKEGINHFHIKEFTQQEFKDYLEKKFKFIDIYNQSFESVSLLSREGIDIKLPKKIRDAIPVNYFIAIASNNPISIDDIGSVYAKPSQQEVDTIDIQVFYKLSEAFNEKDSVTLKTIYTKDTLDKKIYLNISDLVQEIRVDLIDKSCKLLIEKIEVVNKNKDIIDVTNQISTNALFCREKIYTFISDDPQIFINLDKPQEVEYVRVIYKVIQTNIDVNKVVKEEMNDIPHIERKIYLDSGNGFSEQETILFSGLEQDEIEIELNQSRLQNIRLDLSDKSLYIKIKSLKIVLGNDSIISYDVKTLISNSDFHYEDMYVFLHADSQFTLKLDTLEKVKKVILSYDILDEDFPINKCMCIVNNIIKDKVIAIQELMKSNKVLIDNNEYLNGLNKQLVNEKEAAINENNLLKDTNTDLNSKNEELKNENKVLSDCNIELIESNKNIIEINDGLKNDISELKKQIHDIGETRTWKARNFVKYRLLKSDR